MAFLDVLRRKAASFGKSPVPKTTPLPTKSAADIINKIQPPKQSGSWNTTRVLNTINKYNPLYQINKGVVNVGKKAVGIGEPGAGLIGKQFPGINAVTRSVETKSMKPIKQYEQGVQQYNRRLNWSLGKYTPEQQQYLAQHPGRKDALMRSSSIRIIPGGNDYLLKKNAITPQEQKLFPVTQVGIAGATQPLQDVSQMTEEQLAPLVKQEAKRFFKKEGYDIDKLGQEALHKAYLKLSHKYYPTNRVTGNAETFKYLKKYYDSARLSANQIAKRPSLIRWFKNVFATQKQESPKLLQGEIPAQTGKAITPTVQNAVQKNIPVLAQGIEKVLPATENNIPKEIEGKILKSEVNGKPSEQWQIITNTPKTLKLKLIKESPTIGGESELKDIAEKNNGIIRIDKTNKGKHHFKQLGDGSFVIYPNRSGTPVALEQIGKTPTATNDEFIISEQKLNKIPLQQ